MLVYTAIYGTYFLVSKLFDGLSYNTVYLGYSTLLTPIKDPSISINTIKNFIFINLYLINYDTW